MSIRHNYFYSGYCIFTLTYFYNNNKNNSNNLISLLIKKTLFINWKVIPKIFSSYLSQWPKSNFKEYEKKVGEFENTNNFKLLPFR